MNQIFFQFEIYYQCIGHISRELSRRKYGYNKIKGNIPCTCKLCFALYSDRFAPCALFVSMAFSQSVNVRVTTISTIFNSSLTKNRVCPSTFIGSLVGVNPQDWPLQVPVSYQCATTQREFLPHSGLYHKMQTQRRDGQSSSFGACSKTCTQSTIEKMRTHSENPLCNRDEPLKIPYTDRLDLVQPHPA